ncbi:MAG TPA: PEPxxWA-CTERM sorting domain-containing protein [Caulobacteraceae bacterium]|nr:PEPxxWA-CTERM sorting domain-containing protein [Caulobacteraceae bacterium]
MALIAVMCIAGVVSGEMLGPMARLRSWTHQPPGLNQARIIRAGMAGDAFAFPPPSQPIVSPPATGAPRPVPYQRSFVPPPVASSVLILLPPDDGDQGGTGPPAYQFSSEGLSSAIANANFDSSTPPPFVPLSVSNVGADWAGSSALAVAAAPEPSSWLMLILGLGWVGLALRRRRAGAGLRLPMGSEGRP